jgi:hypothetical protein
VGFNRCLCSHTGAIFGAASGDAEPLLCPWGQLPKESALVCAGDVVRGLEVNPGV